MSDFNDLIAASKKMTEKMKETQENLKKIEVEGISGGGLVKVIMNGEGDGQRNKIFAEAFGRDPEFFAFYRAMQAYEKALIGGDTSLVLSPDSEFFKFFGNIKPKKE